MADEGKAEDSSLKGRGPVVALGLVGVVGLLIVAVVIVVSRLGSSADGATGSPSTSPTTSSPSPSASSTVNPLPKQLGPLKTRVLFGVQSVGADIVKGVAPALKQAHQPKTKVMSWTEALKTRGPVFATAKIGKNGNSTSKLRAFAALVNDAPRDSVNVALMAFNYQDVTAETDIDALLQKYQATMESVEQANPDIAFLYTTVPVTGANSWRSTDAGLIKGLRDVDQPVWQDNIARERLNTIIRDRYAGTGRLFDIAALQAQLSGDQVCAKKQGNEWYYVMNPALSSDGKGLNASGSQRIATELLRLVEAAGQS